MSDFASAATSHGDDPEMIVASTVTSPEDRLVSVSPLGVLCGVFKPLWGVSIESLLVSVDIFESSVF
jgi:hypothetical protein